MSVRRTGVLVTQTCEMPRSARPACTRACSCEYRVRSSSSRPVSTRTAMSQGVAGFAPFGWPSNPAAGGLKTPAKSGSSPPGQTLPRAADCYRPTNLRPKSCSVWSAGCSRRRARITAGSARGTEPRPVDSDTPQGRAAAEAMSGAALFQQLAAGAPVAPLDEDEPVARILTDPSQRDRVLEDHYNLLQVCPCCAAAPAPPTRVTHTQTLEL